jgi:Holliday junction DNA helicase RuvA
VRLDQAADIIEQMISYVRGQIIRKKRGLLTVNTGQIGYKIAVTSQEFEKAKESKDIELWTYLAVRENAFDLYGFSSEEELDVFELLITVSGIGPKTAISILSVATAETLQKAVSSGNAGYLVKMSGIGKKNAEKIILELQGKLGVGYETGDTALKDEGDVLEALCSMGYPQRAVREALKQVSADSKDAKEQIRDALKILTKK